MPVYLNEVLALPSMKEATVVAGDRFLSNEVSDIMVMEAPDVEGWGTKGQLLLSSLYSIQDYSYTQQLAFIRKLVELEISGLIIKTNRFVDAIPKGIVEGAKHYHFPIISIPKSTTYNVIMMEVMQVLFNHKVRLLDYYREVHQHFIQLALKEQTAGNSSTLQALENFIHNPVSLYLENQELIAATDPTYSNYRVIDKKTIKEDKKKSILYCKQLVSYQENPKKLFTQLLIPIETGEAETRYLVIHEANKLVAEMDYMAIENAVISLQLNTLKDHAVHEVKQNYHNDLFDDILYGKYSSKEQLLEYAQLLGLKENERYHMVVWQFDHITFNEPPSYESRRQQKHTAKTLMDKILQHYPNLTYRIRSNRLIFALAASELPEDHFQSFMEIMQTIYYNWKGKEILMHVGISDAGTLEDIPEEAKKALQIVQQGGLLFQEQFILSYQDLGIYRMFLELNEYGDLASYIPHKLKLVIEAYPDWIETLQVYLDTQQNLKKTAEKLFVHYKTVRYRLERIKALSHIDLQNPEELLQLQMGLRIFKMQQTFA